MVELAVGKKNIDHLKEERGNWFSRREQVFTSYRRPHLVHQAHCVCLFLHVSDFSKGTVMRHF